MSFLLTAGCTTGSLKSHLLRPEFGPRTHYRKIHRSNAPNISFKWVPAPPPPVSFLVGNLPRDFLRNLQLGDPGPRAPARPAAWQTIFKLFRRIQPAGRRPDAAALLLHESARNRRKRSQQQQHGNEGQTGPTGAHLFLRFFRRYFQPYHARSTLFSCESARSRICRLRRQRHGAASLLGPTGALSRSPVTQ